jgi:ectoine hydroxylase-related dioxygenase (phytanoyl-CoA dioxygenase family)
MDQPRRWLTPEEIQRYDEDGVVCARGLFPEDWLERMARAVDRVVANPTLFGRVVSIEERQFSGDLFVWKTDDDFRDWIYESPAARLAAQVLRSRHVRHFYDQLFVKPPGCQVPTPWHHDITFWPVTLDSRQLCSIWIPFDPVSRETSGLEFVKGSQRWTRNFKAVTPDHDPYMMDSDFEDAPDIDSERDAYDLFGPDLDRGDCLIFDPRVVHGSASNASTDRPRRAFSTRWAGDDVRYEPRHATMPLLWEHGLSPGDPLSGSLFPQVLPDVIPSEGEPRARGPEPPDPALVARVMVAIAERSGA